MYFIFSCKYAGILNVYLGILFISPPDFDFTRIKIKLLMSDANISSKCSNFRHKKSFNLFLNEAKHLYFFLLI